MIGAPRTAEFSARPARRTTSPYQAGKSPDCAGKRVLLIRTLCTRAVRPDSNLGRPFGVYRRSERSPHVRRRRDDGSVLVPGPVADRLRGQAVLRVPEGV